MVREVEISPSQGPHCVSIDLVFVEYYMYDRMCCLISSCIHNLKLEPIHLVVVFDISSCIYNIKLEPIRLVVVFDISSCIHNLKLEPIRLVVFS